MFESSRHTVSNRNGDEKVLLFRRSDMSDLEDILRLQENIAAAVSEDIFVSTSKEELAESLACDYCVGVYDEDRLVAFCLMIYGRITPRNLGTYLGYDDEQLRHCVTNDTTFVHPEYRGYGLQSLLGQMRDEDAIRSGAKEALASVSPDNPHSLENVQKRGFRVILETQLYGGRRRYILRRRF